MARVKRAVSGHKKRRRILKLAKGFYGAKSRQYRTAKTAVMRSQRHAWIGRRIKKRKFRRLWIARINAAARINGLSYSRMMYGLKQAQVDVNRKILADMAVNDTAAFAELATLAKSKLA